MLNHPVLQGLSNIALGIYLKAMYEDGLQKMNLIDSLENRRAFLKAFVNMILKTLVMNPGDQLSPELMEKLKSDFMAGPSVSSHSLRSISNSNSTNRDSGKKQEGEVLKDDTEGLDAVSIPNFSDNDYVN